ncbi:hypothetical protein F4703DRAFT_1921295 [Phycomyces blakesleeanus]
MGLENELDAWKSHPDKQEENSTILNEQDLFKSGPPKRYPSISSYSSIPDYIPIPSRFRQPYTDPKKKALKIPPAYLYNKSDIVPHPNDSLEKLTQKACLISQALNEGWYLAPLVYMHGNTMLDSNTSYSSTGLTSEEQEQVKKWNSGIAMPTFNKDEVASVTQKSVLDDSASKRCLKALQCLYKSDDLDMRHLVLFNRKYTILRPLLSAMVKILDKEDSFKIKYSKITDLISAECQAMDLLVRSYDTYKQQLCTRIRQQTKDLDYVKNMMMSRKYNMGIFTERKRKMGNNYSLLDYEDEDFDYMSELYTKDTPIKPPSYKDLADTSSSLSIGKIARNEIPYDEILKNKKPRI